MKKIIHLLLLVWLSCQAIAQTAVFLPKSSPAKKNEDLRKSLLQITKPYKAKTGVAIMGIEDGDTITLNNDHRYPTQSVYKFSLAMAVLHRVDEGKLSLDQPVYVRKSELLPNTWSPMRDKYPEGNVELPLRQVLIYSVSYSDNNACDILFRLIGGPKEVDKYVHQLGVKDMSISTTEEEMTKGWEVQYTNWTKPTAMLKLLQGLYQKQYLSDSGTAFLLKIMTASENSNNRLKGELPEGTVVAHKTGSSGNNGKGLIAATNDVGIITLPNGKHVAIAVFVADSKESHETNEKIIAKIAKATFDHFMKKNK